MPETNGASSISFTSSPLHTPLATTHSFAPGRYSTNPLLDAFGRPIRGEGDIAQALPVDPLKGVDKNAVAATLTRQIPITIVETGWDPQNTRSALLSHIIGLWDQPTQLTESLLGDSRVQSAVMSRTGGLLGRPIKFDVPRRFKKDPKAQKCLDAFREIWPETMTEAALSELLKWSMFLGFGIAQLNWDRAEFPWVPYLRPWNPRYSYYHWGYFKYIAIGLDGQSVITPGDAHWVLHLPNGDYRGWVYGGALRAVASWYVARQYALRDWGRISERHGMPWIKGKTPASADPAAIAQFRTALSLLGQDTVIQVMVGNEGTIGYDVELIEANITGAAEGQEKLIQQCNAEITMALMGQNLTSEVKEGSFAAARVHADVRQCILEADARALCKTIYTQIARPFAQFNFDDADLAPVVTWDVSPEEDYKLKAEVGVGFSMMLKNFRAAGWKINDVVRLARTFGLSLNLADVQEAPPIKTGGSLGGGGGI
jgi:Protein of unknown function (DUF935)